MTRRVRAARRAQIDTNHDGTISPEERAAAMQTRRAEFAQRQAARFARLDTNGDGAATQDEVGAARWARVSRADADHDGRVTLAELQSAHRAFGFRGHRFHRGQ